MSLKLISFSDTHLGEPESLLYHKDQYNIVSIFIDKIKEIVSINDSKNYVEKLILNGDIVDLAMARHNEIYDNAAFVFDKLFSIIKVKEIIYIPGNHDHHIWVEAIEYYNNKKYKHCTKTGLLEDKDKIISKYIFVPSSSDVKIIISYPNYVLEEEDNYLIFHHGHFIAPSVLRWFMKDKIDNLNEIEELLWRELEFIWWDLKIFEPMPELIWENINIAFQALRRKSSRGTTFFEDALPINDWRLLEKMKWYFDKISQIPSSCFNKNFHCILGHTHYGGWIPKDIRMCKIAGRYINVWNTGAWLVPYEEFSPDAFILYGEAFDKLKLYKFVAKNDESEEGDYNKEILHHRAKFIGK